MSLIKIKIYSRLLIALALTLTASICDAAEVVIVGDVQLKPVTEIVSGIRKSLDSSYKIYSPAEVKGRLKGIVEREGAKVVVALGREALEDALSLPSAIPVIYDLIVVPPHITRPNTTGFYMATPVREYTDLINNQLHSIKNIAVIGSHEQLSLLAGNENPHMSTYSVRSAVELVSTINSIDSADAILLLPDVSLLTAAALEEAYLLSFRRGIPLLGISERHVKQGTLLALVVDTVSAGRRIGEYASKAIKGFNIGQLPALPARKFDLYLNLATARKMGIRISDDMVRGAKRTFQ
ncbi:MAG TPA: ABC transporter substrate binding protein [Desulfuromonadaceae bacterium]|jgi:ABC-type uncharacterized transport system substrate-binding protein